MHQFITGKLLHLIVWAAIFISIIIKLWYFSKLRNNKTIKRFLLDYFVWTPETVRDNMGANENRKQYLKVNNVCMVLLWLLLFVQVLLLFVSENEKPHLLIQ